MKKTKLNIDWKKGAPQQKGVYLVAVYYSTGFGSCDFAFWNGEVWDVQQQVVGWTSVGVITDTFTTNWPEWDDNMAEIEDSLRKNPPKPSADDDFVEFN
ncbi:hypothetical protein EZV61_14795 [Corallincola luteus]|uniref:Uncharacterized protein n=1 Tax=Corallincola luteus TaxID=1775177 RepID=A0ABY2AJ84_9GAMM|nr:hypothetical protein [Corallincola luteus]TCI02201.1 hypothetical protein EZV61_14795 [Corallincola luteus]